MVYLISSDHNYMIRIEREMEDCVVQLLCSKWVQLQSITQGCVQSGLEYCQGWWSCSISGQFVPLFYHCHYILKWNFLSFNSCPLHLVFHWVSLRRVWLNFQTFLFDIYTHWQDLPWGFSSVGWAATALSAFPYVRWPKPWSSSWPFAGPAPVHPCHAVTGEPRTRLSTPGMTLPVPTEGQGHLPQSDFWQHSSLHSPGWHWPSRTCFWLMFNLLTIRTARSLSAKLLSDWLAPSLYCCIGFFPGTRTSSECFFQFSAVFRLGILSSSFQIKF